MATKPALSGAARLPPSLCIVLALASVACACGLSFALRAYIDMAPLTLFYLAILVSSVFGNTRAGALALALSLFCEYLLQRLSGAELDPHLFSSLAMFGAVSCVLVLVVHRLRQSEARLGSLIASAPDAIIVLDAQQRIVMFNPAAEALLQCAGARAIGRPIASFIALSQPQQTLPSPHDAGGVPHEMAGLRSDGSQIPLETSFGHIEFDGQTLVTLILRDIRERKAHEQEIERLTRLYAALYQINQVLVFERSREDMLRKVCQILVRNGPLRLAWIGWHNPATAQLEPVAEWGDGQAYIRSVRVYVDERPEGRGPSGTAFRERRPYICNDMLNDEATLPWREWILQQGFRASAAFPIRHGKEVCGILTVYAAHVGFFRDKEVELLDEAATDISFALDNLARDEERRRAERAVQREREFSDAIIASLPGILYLYDENGRFLRWNEAFLAASGYSAADLQGMHPTQFFAGADVQRVAERIARVFSDGQSSVEAGFVAKDGRSTPYYFTGRRLTFEDKPCLVGVGIDISERVAAERRLAANELKYRELVELANSVILRWSPTGRINFMNEFGLHLFGYSAEEVIGRPLIGTIVPDTDSSGRDLEQLMQRVRADPASFEQNINENMRRNGERVIIAWTNRVVLDQHGELSEILSVGTDITARQRAADALRASEERLRSTLDSILEGCQLIGFDWRYLYLNDAVAAHNRRPNAELLGRMMTEAWPGIETTPVFALLRRSMQQRAMAHDEIEFTFADGTTGWFEVRAQAVPEGILVLSLDITERRRAEHVMREANEMLEREVAKRTEELRGALVRAESADRVKSSFLATMSHELRTPLNSIIGFTGILLQRMAGPINDEQAKQLGMVQASSRHLLDLINDVLDLSKIEAGRMEVTFEPFDLRDSIERVVASLQPAAQARKLGLELVLPPQLPALRSDRRRVEQILLNLLNNAIKFTERGGITVTVETSVAGTVRIRVRDTGVGIRPEDLVTLFQPFRQLDSKLARQHEGTGLGLAICRRLADLLGGTLAAHSERGVGSTFSIELPLQPVHTAP